MQPKRPLNRGTQSEQGSEHAWPREEKMRVVLAHEANDYHSAQVRKLCSYLLSLGLYDCVALPLCQEYRDLHGIESYRTPIESPHPIILPKTHSFLLGSATSEKRPNSWVFHDMIPVVSATITNKCLTDRRPRPQSEPNE